MFRLHAKAQVVAILAFSVMYFGAVFLAVHGPGGAARGGLISAFLNIDAYLASVVAGYLAAAMVRRRGVVIGALTGLLAACLVGIYHFASGPFTAISSDWHFWLASVLLGGCGGLIWHLRASAADARRHL
ncbi:MAG TPA: hypothetical protein VLV87_03980 [Gammaproteobacteria bacterium]|nr:hypothetical protein [Gammaproteobacteria bacterium]